MKNFNFSLCILVVSVIAATTIVISNLVKDENLSGLLFHLFTLVLIIENILYWFYVKQLKSKQ